MTSVAAAPAPAGARTFRPTQRIIGRELVGDRAAAKLECGHVADAPTDAISVRCTACRPIEVLR